MTESKEHKEGSCCKPSCGCSGKKFFIGILAGVLIAMIAHCAFCSGSPCGKAKMCPIGVPAAQPAAQ
jgi:hypothetical protein